MGFCMEFLSSFLFAVWLTKPVWMWLMFIGIVITLLVLDLGVLHKEHREISARESLVLSAVYIGLGLAFGGWVWWSLGATSGMEYLTGFAVEKALAMDNVFVIAMIFAFFAVPAEIPAPRAVLGHPRRHRAARDHDRLWRGDRRPSSPGCSMSSRCS